MIDKVPVRKRVTRKPKPVWRKPEHQAVPDGMHNPRHGTHTADERRGFPVERFEDGSIKRGNTSRGTRDLLQRWPKGPTRAKRPPSGHPGRRYPA